ncbi:hypothetical protein D0N36_08950 [Hymenobacter lapidiphilus]|uniref:hypothetical protein n=1 Tax=Hymenobacter sp. CCM 8763 TaxID=2303334 RepID=UPI000E34C58E|nr:hypothetical protein [Hymenobacter sp. CCM 8763]RFP65389.1 hypothetical protein D0N36_08950 [Hymenobacter sp. CCM 8763]
MAHASGQLGHFLPYLLGRQLRATFWPSAGETRAVVVLFGLLTAAYGLGVGYLLNHAGTMPAGMLPKLLAGINSLLFAAVLLADFLPSYRAVQRLLPEPMPVSARLNVVTAFVLDLASIRRGLLLLFVLLVLAVAPTFWRPLGLSLLVWLSAAGLSFNLRLLLSVGRWRHPLFWLNLLCLGTAVAWLNREFAADAGALTNWLAALAVAGPLLLWAAALYLVAPRFSARYMPDQAEVLPIGSGWLARLSPEWKLYLHKTRPALLMGLAIKVIFLVFCAYMLHSNDNKEVAIRPLFYFAFLPIVGFTYINNNLLGYIWTAAANELERLGLTRRLLTLYLRLAVPIMLAECLVSAVFLLVLFPRFMWHHLLLLPLAAAPALALGLWGSFAKPKPVREAITFSTMRHNASTLINIITMLTAAALYFMPWWWARVALAAAVTLSAIVPVRRILSNHGPTRRRLWQALMHA